MADDLPKGPSLSLSLFFPPAFPIGALDARAASCTIARLCWDEGLEWRSKEMTRRGNAKR